jgi:hypothetical protein
MKLLYTTLIALLISSTCYAQVPSYVPTDGLVGWWPFNGNANDESGNGNNGTLNEATLTTDRFGIANAAYSFNGTSSYINVGNATLLKRYQNDFSISAWVRPSAFSTLYSQALVSNRTVDNKGSMLAIGGTYNNIQGKPTLVVNGGASSSSVSAINILALAAWSHVTVTYQFAGSNNNVVELYVDGALVGSGLVDNTLDPGTQLTYFGYESYSNPNTSHYYNGLLDDIGIWNRMLNADEIQSLYTGGATQTNTHINRTPEGVLVYPNPNCGQFTLQLELQGLVHLRMVDVRGALVHNEAFQAFGARTIRSMDLSRLTPGIYTLHIQDAGGSSQQQVVIH